MQYSRDWFAKMMLFGATDIGCDVHLQEPVTPEVLAIDAWIEPRPKDLAALAERGGRPDVRRALGGGGVPPRTRRWRRWTGRCCGVTLLHQALRERASRGEGAARRTMPERPHLWVICTERAQRLIEGGGSRRWRGGPCGLLQGAP